MDVIKTILERKWKALKFHYYYDGRKGLPLLFIEFRDFIKDTPQLKSIVEKLLKKDVIPHNFFNMDFRNLKAGDSFMDDPVRDVFSTIGIIYTSLLDAIDFNSLSTNLEIKDENGKLGFDGITRVLFFRNEKINIAKKDESDPHKLLKTIFKDRYKVWANDEILEDWGYAMGEKIAPNKVYQAGKAINRIVAQSTKIKDFLEISTKSVSINKQYLKAYKGL